MLQKNFLIFIIFYELTEINICTCFFSTSKIVMVYCRLLFIIAK